MAEKLENGEAIDLADHKKNDAGDYILLNFQDGVDYCDSSKECWIWSIGEHCKTGEILASTDCRFYQNPDYKCLFLR